MEKECIYFSVMEDGKRVISILFIPSKDYWVSLGTNCHIEGEHISLE